LPENWELLKIFAENALVNNDLKSAEEYLWQSIEKASETKSLIKVTLCMETLADLYYRLRRFSEAEAVYSDCVEKQIEALGLDHPEIAITLNKLAHCQSFQNKLPQAEDSLKQALLINLIVFGQSNPQTVLTIKNLSSIYSRQGKVFSLNEVSNWSNLPQHSEPKEQSICKTCHRPFTGHQCAACTQLRMVAIKTDDLERLKVVCATRDIRAGTIISLSYVHLDFRMASKFDVFFETRHVLGKVTTGLIPQGYALRLSDVEM